MPLNVDKIRADFPNLNVNVHGKPLVYLDNAATTLKPRMVLDRIRQHYESGTANVHRGVHFLSEQATVQYEEARERVRAFLNAEKAAEIIFTRGTTEAINLVAASYGRTHLKSGDEILISEMEHHSNIVPWQILCEETGCHLKIIPMNDRGELIMEEFDKLLGERVKLVSVVYYSNSLGTINPVKDIIAAAHAQGVPVVLDAAQALSHTRVDVQDLDCDFLAFSGHKVFGPTGIGVLYGKAQHLERMPPYQSGGDMIASVTFAKTSYNVLPYKFEAGTPHIAGVLGLGAAIEYLQQWDFEEIRAHEESLLAYGHERLSEIPGLKMIGTAAHKASVISFVFAHIHAHDLGTLVDDEGVAVRTGHHCTQPVMQHFSIPATSRASMSFYNTKEDIDVLVRAVTNAQSLFPE